jgi:hypothetical protein
MKNPEEEIMTKSTVLDTVRYLKKKLPFTTRFNFRSSDKMREDQATRETDSAKPRKKIKGPFKRNPTFEE